MPDTQPAAPPLVHEVLRSGGRPLDAPTRASMEASFGHDFSQVRVHTDSRAAESARSINALAYTVGSAVVFGSGRYAPDTTAGRQLLAHELTHTIQQGAGSAGGGTLQPRLAIGDPHDASEREADAVAERVAAGTAAHASAGTDSPLVQRQTPGEDPQQKPPDQKDAADVITEGLKTVGEQAVDNNPQVKKKIVEPLKDAAKGEFNRLSTGEKAATIGFGAGTLGLAGGALLSDPSGRKVLSGVNLAAPLTLIPYLPLTSFKYTLPSGTTPDKRLLKFDIGLKADDLINLHTEARGLPKISLGVNMQWGYDPTTDRLSILGADATFSPVPGLTLSGGAYKDILRPSFPQVGPEGQSIEVKKSIPDAGKPQPIPDVRFMISIDLLKFKPGDLARQIRGLF
jgi:hypothetical protein